MRIIGNQYLGKNPRFGFWVGWGNGSSPNKVPGFTDSDFPGVIFIPILPSGKTPFNPEGPKIYIPKDYDIKNNSHDRAFAQHEYGHYLQWD